MDNPWYVYRFGLEGYCKDNHILVPAFSIDSNGFMVHPITGQKFCPYRKYFLFAIFTPYVYNVHGLWRLLCVKMVV